MRGSSVGSMETVQNSETAALWADGAPEIPTDRFPDGGLFDLAVVGAGITGLASAVLFARAGQRVLVLEGRTVGAGTTGRTTAKVSRLQGTQLQHIRSRTTAAVLPAYAESQRAAVDWLLDLADSSGLAVERRDAYTYAATPQGREAVEREYRLARSVGMPVDLIDDLDATAAALPFPTHGAVRLADQAQLDPRQLLAVLAAELRQSGGLLVERARVTGVRATRRRGEPVRVRAEVASDAAAATPLEVRAQHVILASGAPVLDRGLYFAKLSAHRSYAQAWRVPEEQLPDGMHLGVESPTRSIRTATRPDGGRLLLTGGNGHGVGRHPSPRRASDELAAWTEEWWPGAELVTEWSAQDHLTPHGVPFVGWLPRGAGKVYLATGFAKWGMTNGVATALTLVADVLGGGADWQKTLHQRVTLPAVIAAGIGENAAVGAWYARGWTRALRNRAPGSMPEGRGAVGRQGLVPTAVSRVDGTTNAVCAVCPHLGAIVTWNDFERSWDCPAHGSRFAPDGAVIEGPSRRPLGGR